MLVSVASCCHFNELQFFRQVASDNIIVLHKHLCKTGMEE